MYLNGQQTEETEKLLTRLQQLTRGLLEGFTVGEAITLESIDDLYDHFDKDQLFLIQDGMLHLTSDGKVLFSFDEGDLVGTLHSFDLPCPALRTDEYVELIPIDRDALLRHIYSDKRRQHFWSHFLISQNALLINEISAKTNDQRLTTAGFQNVAPGEVIINQGDSADHVYTIIQGQADVYVDDVKVGEIAEEEVFGAMAVFTGEPRSATVKALTACTVMAVPKQDFVLLIEAQPQAAVNLIENLARHIISLNQQIIDKTEHIA